ncbi:MAG: hypothetical protein AAB649_01775 [Patescibacteria group bacterium]|mgnify:CR=1 FL=1
MQKSDMFYNSSVGDEVVLVNNGWRGRNYNMCRIERTTATQIIVAGRKFLRRDGREIGERYGSRLYLLSQELQEEMDQKAADDRQRDAIMKVKRVVTNLSHSDSISEEAANKILAIIQEEQEKNV